MCHIFRVKKMEKKERIGFFYFLTKKQRYTKYEILRNNVFLKLELSWEKLSIAFNK